MSISGDPEPTGEHEVVLVFRPPENPAAQIAGITPFKGLRVKLEDLLDWFKGLNVESIELWIEGAWKTDGRTELYLSLEGRTGAKVTLRPLAKVAPPTAPEKVEGYSASVLSKSNPNSNTAAKEDPAKTPILEAPENDAKIENEGLAHNVKRLFRRRQTNLRHSHVEGP